MSNYKSNRFTFFQNESGYELFENMPKLTIVRPVKICSPTRIKIKIYL